MVQLSDYEKREFLENIKQITKLLGEIRESQRKQIARDGIIRGIHEDIRYIKNDIEQIKKNTWR